MTLAPEVLPLIAKAVETGRPIVLLLGQGAFEVGSHPDPVLSAALRRLGLEDPEVQRKGYPALLSTPLPADFYSWLAELSERQVMPPWLECIANLPWNAVFTTSVESSLVAAFRTLGRDVEVVLAKNDDPAAPRSRRKLHITHLFGRAGETGDAESPPKSRSELLRRTSLHATSLLARLVETTTPLGLLIIDGYSPVKDWLRADALAGVLSAFGSGQVLWFGWSDSDRGSGADLESIRDLAVPGGPVKLFSERLHKAVQELRLSHFLSPTLLSEFASDDAVSIGERFLELSPPVRLKTSAAASIVDDSWLAPLEPLGQDQEYGEFRRFHGHWDDSRRLVTGVRRGYAIKRTFEESLERRVREALANPSQINEPILLHGQSGSGKSLALARLAATFRAERQCAVLLAARQTRLPAVDEVDEFCLRAEDAGANATLLICDANTSVARYQDLVRGFRSRGRRVVVVGSAYRLGDSPDSGKKARSSRFVEAPAEISPEESQALQHLLGRFASGLGQVTTSGQILAALYRLLPDVRPRLAAGLAREAQQAEAELRRRGSDLEASPSQGGLLAKRLQQAGLSNPRVVLEKRVDDLLGCLTDTASELLDYVMVCGKLDCPIPVNLLLRMVGSGHGVEDITRLVTGIDLIRWSGDNEDDVYVQPRLRLEAEMICSRRLGGPRVEAEFAVRLIQRSMPSVYRSGERRFVIELVRRLGPAGPYRSAYAERYLNIARALTELREKKNVVDPSLMLQEATLRRRSVKDAPSQRETPETVLEEARAVVDRALSEFSGASGAGLKRVCADLKVERAAIYGYLAVQKLKHGGSTVDVWNFYMAARDAARSAVAAADGYYALDVSLWAAADLFRDGQWGQARKAELTADIWDAMGRVEPQVLDPEQLERFYKRQYQISQTLKDERLSEESFAALEQAGSLAGYYLKARELGGGDLNRREAARGEDVAKAEQAAKYLEEHFERVSDDPRCLRYLLQARWLSCTGTFLFGGDRSPLPTEDKDVSNLLGLVQRVVGAQGALGDLQLRYLEAVLLWRLRREKDASDVWRELDRDSEYRERRRVSRQHVWTSFDGRTPRLFQGRVVSEEGGRGRVRVLVEEIKQEVDLMRSEFGQTEMRRGATVVGGFHIAFNYIGPIADRPDRRMGHA